MKVFATNLALCTALVVQRVQMLDDYRLERNSQYRQPHYTDYGAPSTLDIEYDPYRPCFSFIASIKQKDWITGAFSM